MADVPKLIKSRQRVRDYGEVYTPTHIVRAMCDLVPDDRLDTRYLEPSCGNGNFLVEILKRKLAKAKDIDDAFIAISSIYGVDLLPDNVREAKKRLLRLIEDAFGEECKSALQVLILILNCNIQQGDFLTGKKANGEPLRFIDWRALAHCLGGAQ